MASASHLRGQGSYCCRPCWQGGRAAGPPQQLRLPLPSTARTVLLTLGDAPVAGFAQDMLNRIRADAGPWHQLAKLLPALTRAGLDATAVEAETGLERARQNVWAVSEQARPLHCLTSALKCMRGCMRMLSSVCDASKLSSTTWNTAPTEKPAAAGAQVAGAWGEVPKGELAYFYA